MSGQYTEEDQHRQAAIDAGRKLNLATANIPNRTKVVRLFVVPKELRPDDAASVRRFAFDRNATRADVFVVRQQDGSLAPMTWLGDGLVTHQAAHHEHPETVVVLMGIDREQLEWQCDVPFRLTRIEPRHGHVHGFTATKDAPINPFMCDPIHSAGDCGRPIRSGPTHVVMNNGQPSEWNQLYKAHFDLEVDGKWRPLDPDFYCDWH